MGSLLPLRLHDFHKQQQEYNHTDCIANDKLNAGIHDALPAISLGNSLPRSLVGNIIGLDDHLLDKRDVDAESDGTPGAGEFAGSEAAWDASWWFFEVLSIVPRNRDVSCTCTENAVQDQYKANPAPAIMPAAGYDVEGAFLDLVDEPVRLVYPRT